MLPILLAVLLAEFTFYPAFTSRNAVVETVIDKGLVAELIVACPEGPGIIVYSKTEKVFCGPDHTCVADLKTAVRRLCE